METVSISVARNRLRKVLANLPPGGIAIERHGKPVALVVPADGAWVSKAAADKREARLRQSKVEAERLIKHLRIGNRLLSASRAEAREMLARAAEVVEKWERNKLCSKDYIDRWRGILALPYPNLVETMCGDAEGWGPALRQNSPWAGHEYRQGLQAV